MVTVRHQVIERDHKALQSPTERIHLSKIASITALMIAGFFTAAATMALAERLVQISLDPFAAYINVLPGQSDENIEHHGFACYFYEDLHAFVEHCSLHPETGIVDYINLIVHDGIIKGTLFKFHKDKITLGEAMLTFEAPRVRIIGPFASSWTEGNYDIVVGTYSQQFNYFVTVRTVQIWLNTPVGQLHPF
jgi:hypothetical protein